MKQMIRAATAVWLILFLLTNAIGTEQSHAEKERAVDLKKTVALYEEWTTRPSFPESMPMAYYAVYSMQALKGTVGAATEEKIKKYIKSCQKPDGGFVNDPNYSRKSNIIFSFYALKALFQLDAVPRIDRNGAIQFVLSLVQPDGGIKATAKKKEQATLATTYYGIQCLKFLDAMDRLYKAKTVAFLNTYRVQGKGFTMLPGSASSPRATFLGVRSLKSLAALTPESQKELSAYLKTTRYSGEISAKKYHSLPLLDDMADVLKALTDLTALDQVNQAAIYDFVNSLYVPQNGGFGPQPGYGTTPPSTYSGIVCLVQLGRLSIRRHAQKGRQR
jgi:prenyltransferase beta subunit